VSQTGDDSIFAEWRVLPHKLGDGRVGGGRGEEEVDSFVYNTKISLQFINLTKNKKYF